MSMYATLDEARSAGATGSDAEITSAIEEASERVERYTGDLFTPTALTLELDVDGNGVAYTRRRIQTIDSVTWLGAPTPVVSSAYRVSSSQTGGRDSISMYGDLSWADVTVLGAEPWNGGWANLAGREPRISVVGTFGWTTPPTAVRRATALIAARIRSDDVLTDSAPEGTASDAEGNVLPVVPPFSDDDKQELRDERAVVRDRTTGVTAADAALAPYVREPVRMRA